MAPIIRFDDAWAIARREVASSGLPLDRLVLVRDLRGRIRIAVDDADGFDREALRPIAQALDVTLGAYSPGVAGLVLYASSMVAPDEVFASRDALPDPAASPLRLLDRYIIGADWLRGPFEEEEAAPARITFFGVKGGVGRSTALAVLAWRLAQEGRRVLVLDLDLESPGVGPTLLPRDRYPDFGVVDWLVEQQVGQADEELLERMYGLSPLGDGGAELRVVPASGLPSHLDPRADRRYLPKLARAYMESAPHGVEPGGFAERIHGLVTSLEKSYRPDVVLLDSRAGLHDLAAISVTRLGALAMLFAVDSEQTWNAYRSLFEVWKDHPDRAQAFRSSLQVVAGLAPETETARYLEGLRQRAFDLFAECLYEQTEPGEISEFNFDLDDPEAPHSPLRIHWSRALQQFDPVRRPGSVTPEQIQASFGDFLEAVSRRLESGTAP